MNTRLGFGSKIVITGANGIGKTTLLKSILGLIDPLSGSVEQGDYLEIGYFEQEMSQDISTTCIEEIWNEFPSFTQYEVRSALAKCGLTTKHIESQVRVLSGGEQAKVRLCKLINRETNVLMLDEPTNHLDMRTKDVLKQAIRDFNGTVILVSHDREFLDGLVSKVYEFGGGQVREHLGGIYDFLESRKLASLRELEQRATVSKTEKDGNISKDSASPAQSEDSKLSYGEQKEFARRLRKAEKAVADIESEIAGLRSIG